MRGLLREPLLHFLLAGAALFLLYGQAAEPGPERPDRIVVPENRVAMLARSFERTWMRPPSDSELEGLIDDYVTEEVLYREALALGLDRDDLVVRRRMRQKMEFLNDALAEEEPTEDELRAFLGSNPERFLSPSRVSFVQVFVDPDAHGAVEAHAARLLDRLRAGEDPDALGDSGLLPRRLEEATPRKVADTFGASFAEDLGKMPEGAWSGPVESSFGTHLVRIDARDTGRLPRLEEARKRFYDAVRQRYAVEVRMPSVRAPGVAEEP